MLVLLDDPYLSDGVTGGDVWLAVGKALVSFFICINATGLMIWFERKVISRFQNRIGPNIAGPFGVLQTLADGVKLFTKEDIIPDNADRLIFRLAPYLALVPAVITFSVVPVGGDFSNGNGGTQSIGGIETFLVATDIPIGMLLVLAMSSLAVYGVMLAGWASGSKYPLIGSVRASAQAISYEAALGLSLAAVILVSGSLSSIDIVNSQVGSDGSINPVNWNVLATGIVPFAVFFIAATAELNRPPFDLVEAEQELVGGFHTEYSSIRFGLFFVAEFMNTITMSAIVVTLFFGGPIGPNLGLLPGWAWGSVWFSLKLIFFLGVFVWMRATLPRFRYDQLMKLGWKLLIPLSVGWLLLLAATKLTTLGGLDERPAFDLASGSSEFVNTVVVSILCLVVFAAGTWLLVRASKSAREDRLATADRLETEGVN